MDVGAYESTLVFLFELLVSDVREKNVVCRRDAAQATCPDDGPAYYDRIVLMVD